MIRVRTLGRILIPTVLPCLIGASLLADDDFVSRVQPVLENHCYDCHADGMSKGNVAFDEFGSHADRLARADLWEKVLKNLRAEIMPPARKARPTPEEQSVIEEWIKRDVFQIDPDNPDPGRVTLRRLNRVEYQNTIRDLMGIEFRAYEEFPPDDTGYGFDNIGDVLNVSTLLLEKYMDAAETIVTRAVPTVSRVVAEQSASGNEFRSDDGSINARRISFYQPATVSRSFKAEVEGDYTLSLNSRVRGAFDFDPGRMKLTIRLNDEPLVEEEHKWQDGRSIDHEFTRRLPAGEHVVTLNLEPLVPEEEKKTSVEFELQNVVFRGPLAREHWVHPPNYDRFFTREEPPEDADGRREYAGDVLRRFTTLAFRRPVDERTIGKLTAIAEGEYLQPDKSFEYGVGRAMVAVLASPRFLFRTEDVQQPASGGGHPFVDEHALASRLSYFLWATMPDGELIALADGGELRTNLESQVLRMLNDRRAGEFVENFVGQWLHVRDIEGISINERSVLARDAGTDGEMERVRARFRELRDIPDEDLTDELREELTEIRAAFRARFRGPSVELDGALRRAMRRETEMVFEHVLREDRNIIELIDSDYTFLNERLARHYGIPDVEGDAMRRVSLPPDSPRGGVLTHGSVLVVTSNPTRTSPVKRGVFLLDQFLGTPAPPPPPDIPTLEEAEEAFSVSGHEPTLREALERHRSDPLCSSCHQRMDPLGLALENFNALGMWRDEERKQPIEPAGKLITGEAFSDIRELKRILATDRRLDFQYCLTEKLLTYALGRGLENHDIQAVDEIVARLQEGEGRFSALLMGVIESVPFQKRRESGALAMTHSEEPGGNR
ncbi:MAG TPA: DUF1592 domain-containing protein [Methylomirabilota bacterium]|nr:DUF1592 domain-containing protein [Methylomirabilota bacterium]